MGKETPIAKKIIEAGVELLSPKHSFLAIILLEEKYKENSFYKPYVQTLPTNYDAIPIFFSEEELSWFEGSPFLDQVLARKADIKSDYEAICKVVPEFSKYSFWEFCWARMSVCSRILALIIDNIKTDAFVPLGDMLNHNMPSHTDWIYSDQKEGFVIESLEDIPRGASVYETYGRKCNSRFLLNYGFVLPNNDANEIALRVFYKPGDPCYEAKKMLLGETPQFVSFRVLASLQEVDTIEFLNFLRFVNVQDTNTILQIATIYESSLKHTEVDKQEGYKPHRTPPLNIENEQNMLKDVKLYAEEQLKKYKTTLAEDQALLQGDTLTANQRNSVLLRSGEKEVLHYLITFSDTCLPLLGMSTQKITLLLQQDQYKKYSEYISRAIFAVVHRREKGLK